MKDVAVVIGLLLSAALSPLLACHLSSLSLVSSAQNGSEYDITVELCIGGGPGGADGNTLWFQFAFYSQSSLSISAFTPNVTSEINTTYWGYDLGPDVYPAGSANILYTQNNFPSPPFIYFECKESSGCGDAAHQTCREFIFTVSAEPDSIRALMVEGEGDPNGGCYPDTDMIIYFGSPPLPVELTRFDARVPDERQVLLQWETTQEINSRLFEVQRSTDGIHYDLAGEVSACGQCSTPQHYQFLDAPAAPNRYYYRLRIVDQDGSAEFSPVITVELGNPGDALVAYPNPLPTGRGAFFISGVPFSEGEPIRVDIYSPNGLRLQTTAAVPESDGVLPVPLENDLLPGLYFVRLPGREGLGYTPLVVR